ncbi:hypothetical protein BGAL_1079g00010 [Botrytis galanthina]|uniref:Uncharacterized protein n=1 Tax=Botrytis galanthina TaxID=278940 RepID=A0A4S8QL03_9HELO|nr:hypothetical protein BGAL_1079g00010 [Botrytis galanthina]
MEEVTDDMFKISDVLKLMTQILDSGDEPDEGPSKRHDTRSSSLITNQQSTRPLQASHPDDDDEKSQTVESLLTCTQQITATCAKIIQNLRTESKNYDDKVTELLRQVMEKERSIMKLQLQITLTRNLRLVSKNFDRWRM